MILIHGVCDCGARTRRVRSGYHQQQWWFPLLSSEQAVLSDVVVKFSADDRELYSQLSSEVAQQSDEKPLDRTAAREALEEQQEAFEEAFIRVERAILQERWETSGEYLFDLRVSEVLDCSGCLNHSLTIHQVRVRAICGPDCGNKYDWNDSEHSSCPQCQQRPRQFVLGNLRSASSPGAVVGQCQCGSEIVTDAIEDGYCPLCGALPTAYLTRGREFCGRHHERMLPYRSPQDIFFIDAPARWSSELFPNAKLWGDVAKTEHGVAALFCPSCEADHQRWLRENVPAED